MIINTNEIRIPMFNISVIEHRKRLKFFKDSNHYYLYRFLRLQNKFKIDVIKSIYSKKIT